jgi:thiol:disulfide interchange protein
MNATKRMLLFTAATAALVGMGGAAGAQGEAAQQETSLAMMLLFAYVGGLILNIMPCVLPVLSIKALGLVQQAEEGRRAVLLHGIAYTVGVLVSFGVMAGLVIGLQSTGKLVGWGFQLQSPLFVAILGALTFGFGLSLFGVFEVAMPGVSKLDQVAASKHGAGGSFVSGVFAVILATPCTAPFMAPALGFAMSQPPTVLFLFLEVIGLGLATPFLLLGIFPAWVKLVPKPGAWMETFKSLMGFLLVATTIWLIDILGHQVTMEAVVEYLVFLMVLALAAWGYGHWGDLMRPQKTRISAFVVAIGMVALGGQTLLTLEKRQAGGQTVAKAGEIQWKDFASNDVLAMAKAGRTVFVDFTAEWCVTCKVYERTVIETDEIKAAFAKSCVETVKADYTNEGEEITKWLKKYNRPGVPMYLLIPAGKPEGVITLPDLLTKSAILDGLKRSGPSNDCAG